MESELYTVHYSSSAVCVGRINISLRHRTGKLLLDCPAAKKLKSYDQQIWLLVAQPIAALVLYEYQSSTRQSSREESAY
jgi:hypothetical protein